MPMLETTPFIGHECVALENGSLHLLLTRSVGPRIISLRFRDGRNLLAELPEFAVKRPDGKDYHFYGGHRLWLTPEDPIRSYAPDDQPVEISRVDGNIHIRKQVESESGIEKSILIEMTGGEPRLTLTHRLTNLGKETLEAAPWAITQFRTGGVAILPQSTTETGLLPNRTITLWPYADVSSPYLTLGNHFIMVRAGMRTPFKIGFPNPRGWLAYWLEGTLFVKRAAFDPQGRYSDFGCSSECYCNHQFLELESLAPLRWIEPGESVEHVETWTMYPDIDLPAEERIAQAIVDKLELDQG